MKIQERNQELLQTRPRRTGRGRQGHPPQPGCTGTQAKGKQISGHRESDSLTPFCTYSGCHKVCFRQIKFARPSCLKKGDISLIRFVVGNTAFYCKNYQLLIANCNEAKQRWIFLVIQEFWFLDYFFHSRAVIFKSGCFVQKYWSGTVTRKTVIQRADDY